MSAIVFAMSQVFGLQPSDLVGYVLGAFGGAFTLILSLLVVVWKQVEKQAALITASLEKQLELLQTQLTACRARDDQSHQSFRVDLERLRESHNRNKERLIELETREEMRSEHD